ncbi:MAG: gliding motility-associated C-terminal domain-containing protein [Bacteroidota bacterium]
MKKLIPCLFLLYPCLFYAQHDLSALLVPQQPQDTLQEQLPHPSLWEEMEQERTLYSRTYHTADGRVIVHYSKRPLNYYSKGRLVPVDASMYPSASGWCAPAQPYPVYLNFDGSTALTLDNGEKLGFNQNCRVNGTAAAINLSLNGNRAFAADIVPGVDKEYLFRENGLKYNYILKQPLNSFSQLEIGEELVFPEGYELVRSANGTETPYGWAGDLYLLNTAGEVVSRFMAPLCFDANKEYTIASYSVSRQDGKLLLKITLPSSWLNDDSRSYPVVIDPVVIGPTTTWTGGQMPSCITPLYNLDSIQVTIPAAISITGLFVTSSYYADPFTPAVMSQGSLMFSTQCGISQNFTVPNPTGNTPGTAYLDSFNIWSPLMCCFLSNCQQRTFYLRMHLGRSGPSVGCNTTYIRYDPITTLWPFSAFIMGRTVETYGLTWNVPSTPICANQCTITGTVYVRYGVPPYIVSHPWSTPDTIGTLNGCNTGASNHTFTLVIPNCPQYCDTTSSLVVPPPTVTDACGNTVSGLPSRTVPLKPAPDISAVPDSLTVCSGESFSVLLTSCFTSAQLGWSGNSISGTGNISDTPFNTGTSANVINYSAYASLNGCSSDTLLVPVTVDPLPIADFSYTPLPCIANVSVNFTDNSTIYAGTASAWSWDFGDNSSSLLQDPSHTFADPGTYTVCFTVTTSSGCIDSLCRDIEVIAPDVLLPNVITPNGDGTNDLLKFKYLEFFADNRLEVYNRWGNLIFQKDAYTNDWNADKISNGTYYFILSVKELNKTYTGFFEVLR